VVKAAEFLSKRKIGALIVITQKIRLEDHYEKYKKGTPLNAHITADLLCNIFMPHAPLHDGAVIIANGRIEAASCLLPLSGNPQLDKTLGSRHHAALGISEVSDAVSVVVSEETGTISITRNSKINRGLDLKGLERNLERILKQTIRRTSILNSSTWRERFFK
jgi:diadenylate cyclase